MVLHIYLCKNIYSFFFDSHLYRIMLLINSYIQQQHKYIDSFQNTNVCITDIFDFGI